jgi:hypothetical protein
MPVLRDSLGLELQARTDANGIVKHTGLLGTIVRGEQAKALAEDLGLGVAEHPLGPRAPAREDACQGRGHDAVAGRLGQRGYFKRTPGWEVERRRACGARHLGTVIFRSARLNCRVALLRSDD